MTDDQSDWGLQGARGCLAGFLIVAVLYGAAGLLAWWFL